MERARAAFATARANPAALPELYRAVATDLTEAIGSTRASLWIFEEYGTRIRCLALHDTRTGAITEGAVLTEQDFPDYFHAIRTDLKIVAPLAAVHPATMGFDEAYFVPNDIRSLLDHVVLVNDQPAAVLCCEHCGAPRDWTGADTAYLEQMAVLIKMALRIVPAAAAA